MVNIKRYQEIDKQILTIWKSRNHFLKYLQPVNLEEEKERFLSNTKVEEPNFLYSKLDFDPNKIITMAKEVNVDTNDILTKVYKEYIEEEINKNTYLLNLGNRKKVLEISSRIYGIPMNKYVLLAKKYIESYATDVKEEKNITVAKAIKFFEKKIEENRVQEWEVLSDDSNRPISVNRKQKTITIPNTKLFNEKSLEAIYSHEVEGHIYKAENAGMQKFLLFKSFPNYIQTEEGVAIYLESKKTDTYKNNKGVLTFLVDNLIKGATFRESYDSLLEYNLLPEKAFNNCYRVYRGGGITKDFVYLQGFERVKHYLENEGNLKDLYYGKYDIKHIPIIEELKNQGLLVEPKYFPATIS